MSHSFFPLVESLSIKNPVIIGEKFWMKKPEMDILAIDEQGKHFNIEMQSRYDEYFLKRGLYYLRKQYVGQLGTGDQYDLLQPVVGINFVNQNLFRNSNHFHNWYWLANANDPSDILDRDIITHNIDISKKKNKDGSKLADWVELFQLADGYEKLADVKHLFKRSEFMEQAYSQYKSCTEERDMMYEALMREKWERDHIYRDKWL